MKTVADALRSAVETASGYHRDALQDAVEAFEIAHPRSMHDLQKIPGFAALWTAIQEGVRK